MSGFAWIRASELLSTSSYIYPMTNAYCSESNSLPPFWDMDEWTPTLASCIVLVVLIEL